MKLTRSPGYSQQLEGVAFLNIILTNLWSNLIGHICHLGLEVIDQHLFYCNFQAHRNTSCIVEPG